MPLLALVACGQAVIGKGQQGRCPFAEADALLALERHIHTVVGHGRGRIQAWDVINESLDPGGSGLSQSIWLQWLGTHRPLATAVLGSYTRIAGILAAIEIAATFPTVWAMPFMTSFYQDWMIG